MGYSVYFSAKNNRWQGYGVPAYCDHPNCQNVIDRGVGYICCDNPNHTASCGGFFCELHRYQLVYEDQLHEMSEEEINRLGIDSREEQATEGDGIICCTHAPIETKEHHEWLNHVLTDESWAEWRKEEPEVVREYKEMLDAQMGRGSKKFFLKILRTPPTKSFIKKFPISRKVKAKS